MRARVPHAVVSTFPADVIALLRDHPIFGAIELTQLEKLVSFARRRQVSAGTAIFVKGDPGTALYAVLAGAVKVSVTATDGRKAMLSLLHPGDIFGEMALLDGRPRAADVVASTDCVLMMIERRDFLTFVNKEPSIALKLVELLCDRLRRANEHFEEVIFLNLQSRLARTLLQLLEQRSPGRPRNTLKITQHEISHMLGTTRESINKQLRAWAATNVIALQRGVIVVLDHEELVAAAGGAADDRQRPSPKRLDRP
jgi:CRP/FNR family transcriptional regulator, cyclic AMP receptor protein